MNETNTNSFLEKESIGKPMGKYSIPCVISLLVAALYNIVVQIFIANASYLGSYGNAANTVVFPLTVIALAVTARELGRALGSSARPIFTVFESMDEVLAEVQKRTQAIYRQYVEQGLSDTPAFRGVGMSYIRFAMEEEKLFRLLFMSEHKPVDLQPWDRFAVRYRDVFVHI